MMIIMGLYVHYTVESETEIKTTPEKIWEFFYKMEDNYKIWHPECHHYWHWTKGRPFEKGSRIVSEETIGGHKSKIKATVLVSVKNKEIALKPVWPLSFMCPKLEWNFQTSGENTLFVARTHYKFGRLFLLFKKATVYQIIFLTKKHMDEEGENLKSLLEG